MFTGTVAFYLDFWPYLGTCYDQKKDLLKLICICGGFHDLPVFM